MKQKLLSVAKKAGLLFSEYSSKRSDMGCQYFDIVLSNGKRFNDGYYVGEAGGKQKVLSYFIEFINK